MKQHHKIQDVLGIRLPLLTKIFHGSGSHDHIVVEGFTILSYFNGFHTLDTYLKVIQAFPISHAPAKNPDQSVNFQASFFFPFVP